MIVETVLVNLYYRIDVHMNHEFLRWSVARNQNTVATKRVAREGNGAMPPCNSKVCRLI